MSRSTIRGILIFIIVLTIPCYMCGIGVWLLSPDRNAPRVTNTPSIRTNTPMVILSPQDDATVTPLVILSPTSTFESASPISPATFTALPTFTPLPTWTALPSWTPVPTNTSPPTNTWTPIPPATIPPTSSVPLLPPTDTPSP